MYLFHHFIFKIDEDSKLDFLKFDWFIYDSNWLKNVFLKILSFDISNLESDSNIIVWHRRNIQKRAYPKQRHWLVNKGKHTDTIISASQAYFALSLQATYFS